MVYTRKLLLNLENVESQRLQEITQDLFTKLNSNEPLSMAEANHVCAALRIMHSDDDPNFKFDIQAFDSCKNYWFIDRYLLYFDNPEGFGTIQDIFGPVPETQKFKDVLFLENSFQEWKNSLQNDRTGNVLFDHLARETKHHIESAEGIEKYCKRVFIGSIREDYLKKIIILHSKYVFLIVSEYYEEIGQTEQKIELCGYIILIDSFAYIHILFRHFSRIIKEYQISKSYFTDPDIDYKDLPNVLIEILNFYKKLDNCKNFNGRSIDIKIRNQFYTIWFRPFKRHERGGIINQFLRLQTFYPVMHPRDLKKISNLKEEKINDTLSIFV